MTVALPAAIGLLLLPHCLACRPCDSVQPIQDRTTYDGALQRLISFRGISDTLQLGGSMSGAPGHYQLAGRENRRLTLALAVR